MVSSSELIVLEKNLKHQLATVYQRIGHSKSQSSNDHSDAKNYGIKKGQELSIRPGLKSSLLGKLFLT